MVAVEVRSIVDLRPLVQHILSFTKFVRPKRLQNSFNLSFSSPDAYMSILKPPMTM